MISKYIPNADQLLAMPVSDLAEIILKIAKDISQSAGFTYEGVTQVTLGTGTTAYHDRGYPPHKKPQVDAHLNRAWNLLERDGFIEPAAGINGRGGWRILTDAGREVADGKDLAKLRAALAFPKELIHPTIRDKVGPRLRGTTSMTPFLRRSRPLKSQSGRPENTPPQTLAPILCGAPLIQAIRQKTTEDG